LCFEDAPEVSVPTQIPVEAEYSWIADAKVVLVQTLLAGATIMLIAIVVVWAYT
jgi:hypothetical protein